MIAKNLNCSIGNIYFGLLIALYNYNIITNISRIMIKRFLLGKNVEKKLIEIEHDQIMFYSYI